MNQELLNIIIPACSGFFGVLDVIIALFIAYKQKALDRALKEAKMRETYVTCPHCQKKIPLSELSFHLPDGSLDDNLDGIPDSKQR